MVADILAFATLGALWDRLLQVKVTPIPGKKVDHQGIRVQLVGEIELAAERGHPHEFVSLGEPRGRDLGVGRLCGKLQLTRLSG